MNCKPGDLAIVVRDIGGCGVNIGKLVEVLFAAPICELFTMPNGVSSGGAKGPAEWLVKVLGSPVKVETFDGRIRDAMMGVCDDAALRPIRPGEQPEMHGTWLMADFS